MDRKWIKKIVVKIKFENRYFQILIKLFITFFGWSITSSSTEHNINKQIFVLIFLVFLWFLWYFLIKDLFLFFLFSLVVQVSGFTPPPLLVVRPLKNLFFMFVFTNWPNGTLNAIAPTAMYNVPSSLYFFCSWLIFVYFIFPYCYVTCSVFLFLTDLLFLLLFLISCIIFLVLYYCS